MKKHSEKFLRLVESAMRQVRELTAEDVQERLEAGRHFHLVDVREDREWTEGRIPGALHLGKGILERDIDKHIPDEDAEIVLYCGGGFRSALAAESLQKMGYRNVYSMTGGYSGWRESGYPVES